MKPFRASVVRPCMRTLATSALVLACLTSSPHPARACGNAYRPVVDKFVSMRNALTYALSNEEYEDAANLSRQAISSTKRATRESAELLRRDAFHTLAVCAVRTHGDEGLDGRTDDAKTRQGNLDWALSALRAQAAVAGDDPLMQLRYAEALALFPQHRVEAEAILADLHSRGLMTEPRGYAVLAALRRARHDGNGASEAAAHCQLMGGRDACTGLRLGPDPRKAAL